MWMLIPLGLLAIVTSGVLTSRYTGASPEAWEASAKRIGAQLVPKWVSLLNIGGWIALVLGVWSVWWPSKT